MDDAISQISSRESLLPILLRSASAQLELDLDDETVLKLSAAMIESTDELMSLDIDLPCKLGATKEEVEETIQRLVAHLLARQSENSDLLARAIEEAVPPALQAAADSISEELLSQASGHTKSLSEFRAGQRRASETLWGEVFRTFDSLRHLTLELAVDARSAALGHWMQPATSLALLKLSERLFDVAGEVLTLSSHGYADGALARWRSMHEICVVGIFLSRQSNRCANAYLQHHAIEQMRLLYSVYEVRKRQSIRRDPATESRWREMQRQRMKIARTYGKAFLGDYGWAAVELGLPRIAFREIERLVSLEDLRAPYQRASSTIHGGALGALTRVSLGLEDGLMPQLPREFGCEIPIRYAATSLSLFAAELVQGVGDADLVALSMTAHSLTRAITKQIDATQNRLQRPSVKERLAVRRRRGRTSGLR